MSPTCEHGHYVGYCLQCVDQSPERQAERLTAENDRLRRERDGLLAEVRDIEATMDTGTLALCDVRDRLRAAVARCKE